jgi:hypothetical protein
MDALTGTVGGGPGHVRALSSREVLGCGESSLPSRWGVRIARNEGGCGGFLRKLTQIEGKLNNLGARKKEELLVVGDEADPAFRIRRVR